MAVEESMFDRNSKQRTIELMKDRIDVILYNTGWFSLSDAVDIAEALQSHLATQADALKRDLGR